MTLNFVEKMFTIGGEGNPTLQFYKRGFYLGGSGSTPSWRNVVVSGIGSLTLVNAKENGLNYVKAFGACEQTDNVLPSGYTRLDYVTCNNNCRIDTDIIGDNTTVIKARFRVPELQNMYVYACQSSNNTKGITAYITPTVGNWRFGDQTTTIGFEANKWYETIQSASGVSVNGTLYPYDTVNEFTTPYTIILGVSHSSTGGYGTAYFRGDLGEFSIEKGGVLVANYIPCKRLSDNKYGFYDTISETFKSSETTSGFVAGETLPTPYNPVPIKCNNGEIKVNQQGQIYTDGTVETITITGENFDGGTATCENLFAVGEIKDIQSILNGDVTRKVGIKVFDGTESFTGSTATRFQYGLSGLVALGDFNVLSTHYQCFKGNVPLNIMPDFSLKLNSNTAILLIKDSRFNGDETAYKAWLAEQYNSGNPVILLYPLANTTTQTVTAQTLSIQEGTNIVTATGSIDDLSIEVSYKAGVEVTITEVENANLDNTVTVTIH